MTPTKPRVTVILRSKNSDWVIHETLAALFGQTFTDFELLVVDSGSTDRTLEVVRQYPGRLLAIEAADYYPGLVLNRAIQETHSDIIVFLNSDAVMASPKVLQSLLDPFADQDVEAVFGRQVPRPEAHTWVRRDYAAAFPPEGDPPSWMLFSLPLAAMRRTAWEADAFYTWAWGSEDTEWGARAARRGKIPRYMPSAQVFHSHNYTLRELYGRRFIEGEADAFIHNDVSHGRVLAWRIVKSAVVDLVAHIRAGDWWQAVMIPARRCTYHWAHHRGHRWGEKRLRSALDDPSTGQRAVLSRYRR